MVVAGGEMLGEPENTGLDRRAGFAAARQSSRLLGKPRAQTVVAGQDRRRAEARTEIVGSSRQIVKIRELIELYAPESDPVLVCGETGAGKEAVARRLHLEGPRRHHPFVVRNVGRIDRELAGSDFFGHARGAFTGANEKRIGLFQQADKGSLHLDEIGELPIELQANLLRVIEDGVVTPLGPSAPMTVDVRTIAATNADLETAAERGAFRKDLFYRLSALRIDLPPLRDRGDDSVEIAEHLVASIAAERGKAFSLSNEAKDAIRRHRWPGNVRELRNMLRRAAVHVREGVIGADHLFADNRPRCFEPPELKQASELLSRYLVAAALESEKGVILAAAKRIKLNREKLSEIGKSLAEEGVSAADLGEELRRMLDL
jgi:DNA-binding NtrC family response regulator